MNNISLSVVVPLFNEEESVDALYTSIVAALSSNRRSFEVIFVDDGSRDRTFERARQLAQRDSRLKLVRFRRNYGQTPAMAAGIDHASGSTIVTMDGDLQNDPKDILTLVERVEAGADLAVGWRHKRQDKLLSRKVPSKIANWLIGKVTGVPIRDNGCSLKAYRANIIKQVPLYSEMHRFIPAMSTLAGARIEQVRVRHHARTHGQSKYGLSRIYKVLFDLLTIKTITQFAPRALRWFTILAIPFFIVASLAFAWGLWLGINDAASLVVPAGVAVIFAGGAVSLMISGVLSELLYVTGEVRPADFFLESAGEVGSNGISE